MKTASLVLILALVMAMDVSAIDRAGAITLAIQTASRELGVPASTMTAASAEAVQWRDSGMGCASKGTVTRPVLTPGFRVTLTFGGDRAVVHVTEGRAIVCSHLASGKAASKPMAVAAAKAMGLAQAALADRLHVAAPEIAVDAVRPTTWPDESLGCPVAGKEDAQKPVAGFSIDLSHEQKRYRYHTDMTTRVVACDQPPGGAK